jgi:hypothetical protein
MQSRDLLHLFPIVAYMVGQLVVDVRNQTGYGIFPVCTFRDDVCQDIFFAQGRTSPGRKVTKARAGESWHNMKDPANRPASLAVDFAFREQDVMTWSPVPRSYWFAAPKELYVFVADRALKLGFTEIGAAWLKPDGPHLAFTPGWEYDPNGPERKIQMAEFNAGLYERESI